MDYVTLEEAEQIVNKGVSIHSLSNIIYESWLKQKKVLLEKTLKGEEMYSEFFRFDGLRRWLTPYFLAKATKRACIRINRELYNEGLLDRVVVYFFINERSVEQPYLFTREYLNKYINIDVTGLIAPTKLSFSDEDTTLRLPNSGYNERVVSIDEINFTDTEENTNTPSTYDGEIEAMSF